MIIRRIELSDFRNYGQQIIMTEPGVNVFYGDNAQGKTSVLEAVYLCACARSHRTARDSEIIRNQANQYRVLIEFIAKNGSEETIEIEYLDSVAGDPQRTRSQRIVRHNGIKLDRIADLMGLFHAVIFAPEDLMLVKEGPSARRRYLDLLISQIRPSYFSDLQNYSRFLMQRNRLLKNIRDLEFQEKRKPDDQIMMQLDVWDQMLSDKAASIIEQRIKFVKRIAEIAGQSQLLLSSGKEKLYVKYRTVSGIKPEMSKSDIYIILYDKLKSMICEDIDRGTTGSGPHRDDLELSLDGASVKTFASQGQQRSAVLSLKIAEITIMRQDTDEQPVLLLDDVMSELDSGRRNQLLKNINDAQVFVTCTDSKQVVNEIAQNINEQFYEYNNVNQFAFYKVDSGGVQRLD